MEVVSRALVVVEVGTLPDLDLGTVVALVGTVVGLHRGPSEVVERTVIFAAALLPLAFGSFHSCHAHVVLFDP